MHACAYMYVHVFAVSELASLFIYSFITILKSVHENIALHYSRSYWLFLSQSYVPQSYDSWL